MKRQTLIIVIKYYYYFHPAYHQRWLTYKIIIYYYYTGAGICHFCLCSCCLLSHNFPRRLQCHGRQCGPHAHSRWSWLHHVHRLSRHDMGGCGHHTEVPQHTCRQQIHWNFFDHCELFFFKSRYIHWGLATSQVHSGMAERVWGEEWPALHCLHMCKICLYSFGKIVLTCV